MQGVLHLRNDTNHMALSCGKRCQTHVAATSKYESPVVCLVSYEIKEDIWVVFGAGVREA